MPGEKIERVIETAQTILLSGVVLITAWCGYQSAQWSGITSFKLAASHARSIEATEKSLISEKRIIVDSIVVVNFANAMIERNQEVVNFYLRHLRPEFAGLLRSWLDTQPLENPEAPPHPLAMPAYAKISQGYEAESIELRRQQEARAQEAYEAKRISDEYTFKTVVLASVLFIGGIFQTFRSLMIRLTLLGLDYTIALVTFSQLLSLPAAKL